MDKSPKHFSNYFENFETEYNNPVWELVRKAHEDKKYKEVFYRSLNYINGSSRFNESLLESKSLQVLQGGRPIDISWDDDRVKFKTELLNFHGNVELAALRKMSEFSFYDLKLVQLKVIDDKIILLYQEEWIALDPYKLFDVMEDLCNFGDFLESYMVKKFGLVSLNQTRRTFVENKKIDAAWGLFQEMNKETKQLLDDFEKKRWRDSIVELFWNYLQKIEFTFSPRAYLKLEIKSALTDLNPGVNFDTMYAKVFTNFKKISEISKENFQKSFFKEKSFMPARRVAYVERTKMHFDDYMKNAFQYRNKQDHILTTLYLNTAIYTYLNRYFCEKELEVYLKNLLNRGSVANWKTSSERLYQGIERYLVNPNLVYQESVGLENTLNTIVGWFKRLGK